MSPFTVPRGIEQLPSLLESGNNLVLVQYSGWLSFSSSLWSFEQFDSLASSVISLLGILFNEDSSDGIS